MVRECRASAARTAWDLAAGPGMGQTHIHDEEVEPAPGAGKVHLEAIGHPLEQHLHDEDVGEDPIGVFQDGPDDSPLLDVDVLEGLGAPAGRGGQGPEEAGAAATPLPA